jgi:replicative DNA helicase
LTLRLICSESRIDSHRLRTGYIRDREWTMLSQGVGRLYSAPIYIDDSTEVNALQMRAKCRRLKAEQGISLVIVDYLQLMQSHRRAENRNQEISEISRGLKSLARELGVPLVALSQLSRAVEKREDRKPVLSDLRESGAIEAEADLVAFLHRPAYYQHKELTDDADIVNEIVGGGKRAEGQTDVEETEIIIAKHRNGPTGSIKLNFLPKFASFVNVEEHRMDEE